MTGQPDKRLAELARTDWDFLSAPTSVSVHRFHPYPAKFIPQIPAALIAHLSDRGDIVFDPFCGSGTTLVEAILQGRAALGADVNPIAVMIATAKTIDLKSDDELDLEAIVSQAEEWLDFLDGKPRLGSRKPELMIPTDEGLAFWFDPWIVEELGLVNAAIARCRSAAARLLARVALSSVIVNVSKQDSDTRYVRRQKNLRRGVVPLRLRAKIGEIVTALRELPSERGIASTWIGDARRPALADDSVDLVVTSPPYPNAYSYHLYHRTRLIWMGFDPARVKEREIGSHRRYSSRNGATRSTFLGEMVECFGSLRRCLRREKHACFVMGDSIIRGENVDNSRVLEEAAKASGFSLIERFERRIDPTRKSFNPTIGKIKSEHVLIFRAS